ncbi:glutaredoxin [Escherichia coli]|uniref:Glutaredoxin n=1 Tax=Escherichia coli TaxID=562 RepID=A0A376W1K0_ECOLX|nr:glutaredoxin [Escherichia coli]
MEESREAIHLRSLPLLPQSPHDFRPEKYPRRITCSAQRPTQKHPPGWSVKNRFPILQKDDSRYMPESMDIVHYVDKLDGKPLLTGKRSPAIEEWLRKVNGYANKLLLPRFAKSAFDEFSTPAARKYFVDKKEASAGNFADLLAHSDGLIKNISDDLRALDKLIVKPKRREWRTFGR